MKSPERLYDIITNTGFFLLAGGLLISKFAVTLGVGILAISALAKLISRKVETNGYIMKVFIPLVGLFLWLGISALYSENRTQGFAELQVQNGLLSIPILLTIHWAYLKSNAVRIVHTILAVGFIASFCALFFYALPTESAKKIVEANSFLQDYPDVINKVQFGLYSPFIDRLHFAYGLCFCVLTSIFLFFRTSRIFFALTAAFFSFMILILGARGAQLGLLIALLPFLIFHLKSKYPEMKVISVHSVIYSVIFLVSISILSYEIVPSVQKRYDQMRWELSVIKDGSYKNHDFKHFTTLTRLKSIEYSLEIIRSNPILGTGIGDVSKDLKSIYLVKNPEIPAHHQNYYLYLWMSGGIIAMGAFLFFLGYWIKSLMKETKPLLIKSYAFSYLIFIVVILMIDAPMKYHLGAFGIPFFMAMVMALIDPKKMEYK